MQAILDPIFQEAVQAKSLAGIAALVLDKSGTILFKGEYGNNNVSEPDAGKTNINTALYLCSCSKIFTVVAALQLIERGLLSSNSLAEQYIPEVSQIPILKGFDADNEPILCPAEVKITILHLLTHTAGFTYDNFDAETTRYRNATGQPVGAYFTRSAMEDFATPLCAEPGTRYSYGVSIDWLGFVVEKVVGMGLGEYVKRSIIEPLNLQQTGPAHTRTAGQASDFLEFHGRGPSGATMPINLAFTPTEIHEPGGHFIISSVNDFTQLLLTLLNNGTHPISHTKILEPQTVQHYLFTDLLPLVGAAAHNLGEMTSANPDAIRPGTYLPHVGRGGSAGLLINHDALPNGRSAGSASWLGFGNAFYWMDPEKGLVGFLSTELVPFWDKDILFLADAMERAAYGKPLAKTPGEYGSNFAVHEVQS